MVLGERIKDPLRHDLRYILLNIILQYKRNGIRLVELSRITGKKNHSLRHHLDILEKKKLVYTKSDAHQLHYFPDPQIPKHTRIGHPLENAIRSKVLETILDGSEKGINVGVIHRKLKISRSMALRILKILKYFNLVRMEQNRNNTFCYPTIKTQDLVRYVKEKIALLETIQKEDGILLKDLESQIDNVRLECFKLCVYMKRNGSDSCYYLTPFVENLLNKYGS